MRWILTGMLALTFVWLTNPVRAYPTLYGPTGGAALPTAEIASGMQLAADWYDTDVNRTIPARATFGLGSGVELGGYYAFNDASNVWGADAKYNFMLLGLEGWAIGALYNREVKGADRKTEEAYALYTYDLSPGTGTGLALTAGANWTRLEMPGLKEDGLRGFAVGEINLGSLLSLSAEYQTKRASLGDPDPLTSAVARLKLGGALGLEAGWTNADRVTGQVLTTHNMFAGVTFGDSTGGMGRPTGY